MRVMWIIGRVPAVVAAHRQGSVAVGGTWQDALLERIATELDLELMVAFPGGDSGARVEFGGVTFADIGSLEPTSGPSRVLARWLALSTRSEPISRCLDLAGEWGPDLVHIHGTESGIAVGVDRFSSPTLVTLQGLLSSVEAIAEADRTAPFAEIVHPGRVIRGLTPWHARRAVRAAAAAERIALGRSSFVAGRTTFDERVASVLAPNATYLHVGEVLRSQFYGPHWTPRARDRSNIRVCMCGTKYHRKGTDVAMDAVALLLGLGLDITLIVFGLQPGGPDLSRTLSGARARGLTNKVEIEGPLDAQQVVDLLLSCDAYVHPTRVDNSPNGLCEAMLLGVPCIASEVGGIPSLATDGQDALLVSPGDCYSLAGGLAAVASDRTLAARLSDAARVRAAARHEPNTVVEELVSAYRQMVAASDH